ncbi:MAG: hypothetical protein PHW74_03615 [Desulfobacca sp.]|nr:hypothetical protein [Desulfobacca sp.]
MRYPSNLLENINKAITERDKKLVDYINRIIRQQNLSGQISVSQQQKEFLAYIYRKAASYTNLVIIAGYTGIFAVWQLTKNQLTDVQEAIVALLSTASLLLFAGYEVYKMISQTLFLRRLDRITKSQITEVERPRVWQLAWDDFSRKEIRVWSYFLIPTLLTGFGAGFLLLWIFAWPFINYLTTAIK